MRRKISQLLPLLLSLTPHAYAQTPPSTGPLPTSEQPAIEDTATSEAVPQDPATLPPGPVASPEPVEPAPPPAPSVAPNEAMPAPPELPERKWRMGDSHLIIGAEGLVSFEGWLETTKSDSSEFAYSGLDVNLFNHVPTVSFDFAWVGTVGVILGYNSSTSSPTALDGEAPASTTDSSTYSNVTAGIRGGVMLGRGSLLSVWLRLGYTYTHS